MGWDKQDECSNAMENALTENARRLFPRAIDEPKCIEVHTRFSSAVTATNEDDDDDDDIFRATHKRSNDVGQAGTHSRR